MTMDIGKAITEMRCGRAVARTGWNGRGMLLRFVPREYGDARDPGRPLRREYVEMQDAQGMLVPWLASQTDLLAHDWVVVG